MDREIEAPCVDSRICCRCSEIHTERSCCEHSPERVRAAKGEVMTEYGCACRWVADAGQTRECGSHAALREENARLTRERDGAKLTSLESCSRGSEGGVMWGLLWRSRNILDGAQEYLLWDGPAKPLLYRTRGEARADAMKRYGYIKDRKDLRREPHGWRMPVPVRVEFVRTAKGK